MWITPTRISEYHETLLGLPYPIILYNIAEESLQTDGVESVCITVPNSETIAIFVAGVLCFMPVPLLGIEGRLMRRAAALSGEQLSGIMGISVETLSRWEAGLGSLTVTNEMDLRKIIAVILERKLPGFTIQLDPLQRTGLGFREIDQYPVITLEDTHADVNHHSFKGLVRLTFNDEPIVTYTIDPCVPLSVATVHRDDPTLMTPDPDGEGALGAFGFAAFMRGNAMTTPDDVEMVARKFECLGHEISRLRTECREAYLAVGNIAQHLNHWTPQADTTLYVQITKLLDNLAAAADGASRPHDSLLPCGWTDPVATRPCDAYIQTFIDVFQTLDQFEATTRMSRGLGVFSAKDLPIEGVPQMITWLRSLLHNKSGRKTDLDIPSPIGQLRLTQDRAPVTDTALVDHPVLKDEYGRVVASIHTDAHPVIPSGVTFAELDLFTATNVKDTEVLPFSNSNEMERDWHRFQETIKNQAAEIERLTQTLQTETYQARAQAWIIACFGLDLANDKTQRNQRLLEETCELVQKGGCTLREIKQIAEWVYTRPMRGGMEEDVGGVMHSLAAFCSAYGMNMHEAGEIELLRVWENADHMRKTFATKPMFEPEVEESTVLVEKAKAGQVSQAMLKAASASYARNGSMRIALEAAVREQITPRRPQ